MFDVGFGELLTIAVVALLIGPDVVVTGVRKIRQFTADLRAAQKGVLGLLEAATQGGDRERETTAAPVEKAPVDAASCIPEEPSVRATVGQPTKPQSL